MITRATLSTIEQGLPKYRSMLAGNSAYVPPAYESIASATGGSASITFSSIPSTFKHLQIRGIHRGDAASSGNSQTIMKFNSSSTDYTYHAFRGDGSSVSSVAVATGTYPGVFIEGCPGDSANTQVYGTFIVDILDYASTSKYKNVRIFAGLDRGADASGLNRLASSLWLNTSAINEITCTINAGWNYLSGTTISLYGIRG